MIEVKAPHSYAQHANRPSVFLAGSIEMGLAEDWQARVVDSLKSMDIVLLNPRRDNWDSSWPQSIDCPPFRQQVEWELDALDAADLVVFYFDPKTKSPITMMELGIQAAANPAKLVVCCPDGFWRKGNIDIVCKRYGVRQADSFDGLIDVMVSCLRKAA